jgi:hypothetical protein
MIGNVSTATYEKPFDAISMKAASGARTRAPLRCPPRNTTYALRPPRLASTQCHGASSTVTCRWPIRGITLRAPGPKTGTMRRLSARYWVTTRPRASASGSGGATMRRAGFCDAGEEMAGRSNSARSSPRAEAVTANGRTAPAPKRADFRPGTGHDVAPWDCGHATEDGAERSTSKARCVCAVVSLAQGLRLVRRGVIVRSRNEAAQRRVKRGLSSSRACYCCSEAIRPH